MQCKRYAPEMKVAVAAVRQLYGIAESFGETRKNISG